MDTLMLALHVTGNVTDPEQKLRLTLVKLFVAGPRCDAARQHQKSAPSQIHCSSCGGLAHTSGQGSQVITYNYKVYAGSFHCAVLDIVMQISV